MKGKLIPAAVIKLLWEKFTMKVKIQTPGIITGPSRCVLLLCSQLSFCTLFALWLQGKRDTKECLGTVMFANHHCSHRKGFENYFV